MPYKFIGENTFTGDSTYSGLMMIDVEDPTQAIVYMKRWFAGYGLLRYSVLDERGVVVAN
jgi:hypothetical protein